MDLIKPVLPIGKARNLPQHRGVMPQKPRQMTPQEEKVITRYARLSQTLYDALTPIVDSWEGKPRAEPVAGKYAVYLTLDQIITAQRALNENGLDIYV